jgi:hypothetical protein
VPHLHWGVCRWQEGLSLGLDATKELRSGGPPSNSQAPMVPLRNASQLAIVLLQAMFMPALPVDPATVAIVPLHHKQALSQPRPAIYFAQETTHFAEAMMEARFTVRCTATFQVEVLHVQL